VGTLLFLLSIPAYFYAGYYVADKSKRTWEEGDDDSLAARLLFPFNAQRGTVGEGDFTGIEIARELFEDENNVGYSAMMMMFWPLKVFMNLPGIAMFGGPAVLKQAVMALAARRGVKPRELLPQAGDDIPALYGKVRDIDSEIRELLIKREIVDEEIEHQKTVLSITVETEESLLDAPEIPQLTDGGEREEGSDESAD